jgi:hypothetical protein
MKKYFLFDNMLQANSNLSKNNGHQNRKIKPGSCN